MYEIGILTRFEAAHRLRGDFGAAARLHGHTYRVEIVVRGPSLRADGTLCDIGILRRAAEEVVAELDYRDLDELPSFAGQNSTAEAVARHFVERITPRLCASGLATLAVRVWEAPDAFGGCEGELD